MLITDKIYTDKYTYFNNDKTYKIIREEGVIKGIFFRSPIQEILLYVYQFDIYMPPYCYAYKYLDDCNNWFFRIFQKLIGNSKAIKTLKESINDLDFGGVYINKIVSPIYFETRYMELNLYSLDEKMPVKHINSFGYENPFDMVQGHCVKEWTKTEYSDGEIGKSKVKGEYRNCYVHEIEEFLGETFFIFKPKGEINNE